MKSTLRGMRQPARFVIPEENLLPAFVHAICICFHPHPSRIIGPAMPSFPDTAVLVLLALLLFGPKKLPVLARQLGKLMADFRRASNEFRTQMEEELRISEQAERQKQIAALEASAAPSPTIDTPATSETTPHDTPAAPESHYDADSPIEY